MSPRKPRDPVRAWRETPAVVRGELLDEMVWALELMVATRSATGRRLSRAYRAAIRVLRAAAKEGA